MTSFLLTEAIAKQAVELARPSILQGMITGVFKRADLHITIMNPSLSPWNASAPDAVLYEESFGDVDNWEGPYKLVARSKGALAWEHKVSTHQLVTTRPYLLRSGETVYPGGVWLEGVPVGVSGVQSEHDEAIAYTVAAFCRALAIARMKDDIVPSKVAFIGT